MRYMERMEQVTLAVKFDPDVYQLIKSAAYKQEMSLAQFVRKTLREAAEFYADAA